MRELETIASKNKQWGLVAIDKDHPDTIYTATYGASLLIGFSQNEKEVYVASEKIALAKNAD